ncbi:MAG: penicillin acylase family protein [Desulfobacteraceae bacterium]|nr:penicillin acylase family protein [Desulfobacteraceae bacterium]
MKQIRKLILYPITILVAAIILLGGGTWIYLTRQLPDIDATLVTSQVKEKTRIIRDKWGVPHIQAANGDDAYFALGFTTAQDRLFQMELQRRLAKGELAQIFGPGLLSIDKMFSTLMLKQRAEDYLAQEKNINHQALQFLDAFLRGINYFITTGPLPVEYTLLGFKPKPFTRLDTISMLGYVAYSFADGIKRDSLYTILEPYLTVNDLKMVFPDYALENKVSIMEPTGPSPIAQPRTQKALKKLSGKAFAGLTTPLQNILNQAAQIVPAFTGSNSWVLAPTRSKNGHALLANDPHIGIANPGVWYEAHVQYPGYENYGYHLPLMPFPMLAHNKIKAWAITMFENDDLDLYGETFHPDNPTLVKFKGEWTQIKTITKNIKVKGESDKTLTIRITPHGPVISDFIKGYEGTPVSISWVYHKMDNPILDVVFEMGKATNMTQFRQAVSKLAAPGLNISYIDHKGNIAWWAAGRLPIRPSHVSGKKIHDGSSGKDEALGYLPFESNPHLVNPDNGIIITANNQATFKPIDPIGILSGYFRPSDRAARIYELLNQKEKWSLEEFKKIQTDSKIYAGTQMTTNILAILDSQKTTFTRDEQKAFIALKSWDGFMKTQTIGGTVFQFTIYHILKQTLEPHIGSENLKTYLNLVDHWDFLKQILKTASPPITGTNPSLTPQKRDTIILNGFKNAVTEITTNLGTNEKNWTWGSVHTIEYVHPIGKKKPFNLLFNVGPFPSPAEFTAINKLKSKTGDHNYKVSSLPSTRRLIDCNDPKESWSIIPTGNSGNFMSNFYDDQAKMFIKDKYRRIIFTKDEIQKESSHILSLLPE